MTLIPIVFSRSPRRATRALPAVLAVALIASACGGSSPSSGSSTAAAGAPVGGHQAIGEAAFRFSACMRAHGLSNFPDPIVKTSASQSSVIVHLPAGLAGTPAFKSAQAACQHILPKAGGGPDASHPEPHARVEAEIAFARCMRSHGFPSFPDPDATGQLSLEMLGHAGINLHNPGLLSAGKGCAAVTNGQLTPAQVAAAINHANASGSQSSSGP